MSSQSPENRNPFIPDAATLFDIEPGVELEVTRRGDSTNPPMKVTVIGELKVDENNEPVVYAKSETVGGGIAFSLQSYRNLRELGIAPYPKPAEPWDSPFVSRVVNRFPSDD